MPPTRIILYRNGGRVYFREWMRTLPVKAQAKCIAYLRMLQASGHELRRPTADFLRDGIYELRPAFQGVSYRILYFFSGRNLAVVSAGLTKESDVPAPVRIRPGGSQLHGAIET